MSISFLIFSAFMAFGSFANFCVHFFACASNSFLFFLYCFATWASWGSSGSGVDKRAWSDNNAVLIVSAGLHSFFNMSKHIAPVWEETLGCHTFVMNFIFGGSKGYSLGILMSTAKVPPSYTESFGPFMYPVQCV